MMQCPAKAVMDETEGVLNVSSTCILQCLSGAKLKLDIGGELQSLQLTTLQMSTLLQKPRARTGFTPPAFHVQGGERILCLDGGGIKGLIQVEVLMQIEQLTGRAITELFDWIVGTSTGGVIALAMVYSKCACTILRHILVYSWQIAEVIMLSLFLS